MDDTHGDLARVQRTIDRLGPRLDADAEALDDAGMPAMAADYRRVLEQIRRLADDVKTAGATSPGTEERS